MPAELDGVGAILMTYGSPADAADVGPYLARVRGGREPSEDLVAEFRRRYHAIGGSPLVRITTEQAAALEARLGGAPVAAGMRFSSPTIADALADVARRGARHVVAIVLSPQYSPLLMGGYARAVEAAREAMGTDTPRVSVAGAWHDVPEFIEALACRIRAAIDRQPAASRNDLPVLLTAHSLPRHIADTEPDYLRQLEETATAVADAAGLHHDRWTFCWQSAGHEPGEWMKPDFAELMPRLRARGHTSVLVAPVQFLADHLEILYDIDIAARAQAEAAGLAFARIESLGTLPLFIDALATVVELTLAAPFSGPSQALARS